MTNLVEKPAYGPNSSERSPNRLSSAVASSVVARCALMACPLRQQCYSYQTHAVSPGIRMMDSLLRLRGCAQPCAAPNRQECPFNGARGHRRDPSRPGRRRDRESRDHRRDSGIRPGCRPTPGPRSRLGKATASDAVTGRRGWAMPTKCPQFTCSYRHLQ